MKIFYFAVTKGNYDVGWRGGKRGRGVDFMMAKISGCCICEKEIWDLFLPL